MLRSIAALPGPTAIGYPGAWLSGGADFICNIRKASEKDRRSYWPPIKTSPAFPEVALSGLSLSFYADGAGRFMAMRHNNCHQERLCAGRRVAAADTRSAVASSSWIERRSRRKNLIQFTVSQSSQHCLRERSKMLRSFKFHTNARVFSRAIL